jgi:hypothetical protein
MKKIKIITGLLLVLIAFTSADAQNSRGRFDVKEFHEKKWQFIVSETKLSPAETTAVKPVFMNYENNVWELHKQTRELFLESKNGNLTEKQYNDLNSRMINLEIKRSQYLREYHLKLRKLLKPQTLFHYYKAEKSFERQLLQRRGQGSPSGKRR